MNDALNPALAEVAAPGATTPRLEWGDTRWPDGADASKALTAEAFGGYLQRLRVAPGSAALLRPMAGWAGVVAQRRPDAPVPLAVASFDFLAGAPLQRRQALLAGPLLHTQWGQAAVGLRSRVVSWWLDRQFMLTAADAPALEVVALDAGDGRGPRSVPPSGVVSAAYAADLARVELVLHVRVASQARIARCSIGFNTTPPAPLPDQTLALTGNSGHSGTAWVFLAPGRTQPLHPLLVVEGFPGGYACDYLHDMFNQQGTLNALRAAGYDVVLVGLARGSDAIEDNASVLVNAIRQMQALTPQALVVGGVSMGGLVARYALAWMEWQGLDHRTRCFFTHDTPHQGATTSIAAQWFAQAFADCVGGAADLAGLLDSPANQQFVRRWLTRDAAGLWRSETSPLREHFVAALARVGGYPRRPRKVALSCGRGDGQRSLPPGATLMSWQGLPSIAATLAALPEGGGGTVGAVGTVGTGAGLVADAALAAGPCSVSSHTSWEGAPGSTDPYVGLAAAMASATGCGTVQAEAPLTTAIPTASALDLAIGPYDPVPADTRGLTPFDAVFHADSNLPHLTFTPALRDALLQQLGAP